MMDGQMTIDDWLNDRVSDIEKQYPIPRLSKAIRREEGWVDDWHYCEIESPNQPDVYIGILLFEDHYNYCYLAWTDKWHRWDSWKERWKDIPKYEKPLAWAEIPVMYRKKDVTLPKKLGMEGVTWTKSRQ